MFKHPACSLSRLKLSKQAGRAGVRDVQILSMIIFLSLGQKDDSGKFLNMIIFLNLGKVDQSSDFINMVILL